MANITKDSENPSTDGVPEKPVITEVPENPSTDGVPENIVITEENNISINGKQRVLSSKIFPEQRGGTSIKNVDQYNPVLESKMKILFEEMSFYNEIEQEEINKFISSIRRMENLNLLNIKVLSITLILIYLYENKLKDSDNIFESQELKNLIIEKFSLENLENKNKNNTIRKYTLDIFRYFVIVYSYIKNREQNISDKDDIIYNKIENDDEEF